MVNLNYFCSVKIIFVLLLIFRESGKKSLNVTTAKFFDVIGFDINEQRVSELRSGTDKTLEVEDKDLKEVLIENIDAPIASPSKPPILAARKKMNNNSEIYNKFISKLL